MIYPVGYNSDTDYRPESKFSTHNELIVLKEWNIVLISHVIYHVTILGRTRSEGLTGIFRFHIKYL